MVIEENVLPLLQYQMCDHEDVFQLLMVDETGTELLLHFVINSVDKFVQILLIYQKKTS